MCKICSTWRCTDFSSLSRLRWSTSAGFLCSCFELKVPGLHLALVFTASLSEVENGVKPCRISKTIWNIQTQLICCIEDFKVLAGKWTLVWKNSIPIAQDLSVMDLELRLPAWILVPNNGKRLSLKGTRKKICPARNELALTVLRLYGFPSTDFSGFCVKKVSTWLTILPAPWFQMRLEFFSPSSTLKSDVNGWFNL